MTKWKTKEYLEKQEKNKEELKKVIDRLSEMAKDKKLTWNDIYKEFLKMPRPYLTALDKRMIHKAFNVKGA